MSDFRPTSPSIRGHEDKSVTALCTYGDDRVSIVGVDSIDGVTGRNDGGTPIPRVICTTTGEMGRIEDLKCSDAAYTGRSTGSEGVTVPSHTNGV